MSVNDSGTTQPDEDGESGWVKAGKWLAENLKTFFGIFRGETQHLSWSEANEIALKTVQVYSDYMYRNFSHDAVNFGMCDLLRTYTADWIKACVDGQRWANHTNQDNYRYVAALRGEQYVNVTKTNWDALRGKDEYLKTILWLHFMWLLENFDKERPDEYQELVNYDLTYKTLKPAMAKWGLIASANTPAPPPAVGSGNSGVGSGASGSVGSGIIPTDINTSVFGQALQGNVGVIVVVVILLAVMFNVFKGK